MTPVLARGPYGRATRVLQARRGGQGETRIAAAPRLVVIGTRLIVASARVSSSRAKKKPAVCSDTRVLLGSLRGVSVGGVTRGPAESAAAGDLASF